MKGGNQLLLLAVFVLLARCQQKPQVSMSPNLQQIFSGDIFYLSCNNTISGITVKWYFNNTEEEGLTNKTWEIAVATPKRNGVYHCESNGQKSDSFPVNILDYAPSASLTIKTGQPVMRPGGSVVLQLDHEDGLQGWNCWVYEGKKQIVIKLRLQKDSVSVAFQPNKLSVLQSIFWCADSSQQHRSNQIIVRTSGKDVSLEMYPLPAVVGESLTLKCLAWGTNQISHTVFYKDSTVILESVAPIYKIPVVTESAGGKYKCIATFTHMAYTDGPPYQGFSDYQDVLVQGPLMKAVVSANNGLSCSCPRCPDKASYHWYHKSDHGQPWALMNSSPKSAMLSGNGSYACRAVWSNGRSFLSSGYVFSDQPPTKFILTVVLIVMIILSVAVVAFCIWYKKRNKQGPIYEDIGLRDNKYEALQRPGGGAMQEAMYDTLHPPEPATETKEGEHQLLKKDETQVEMEMEGAAEAEGRYEALKKEGMKEGVYHTLQIEGGQKEDEIVEETKGKTAED